MKLKCRINEKEYDNIVAGATFSEEYNETLDSGSIILDHIGKIPNLKPYDDVYIWNADDDFFGYYNVGDKVLTNVLGGKIEPTINKSADILNPDWEDRSCDISFEKKDDFFYLSGEILNIWSSLMFKISTNYYWRIDEITFSISLYDETTKEIIVGYYKLGLSKSDLFQDKYWKFYKNTNYSNQDKAPQFLYIPFSSNIPNVNYLDAKTDASLVLGNSAIVVDELIPNVGRRFKILDVGKPNKSYRYTYFKNLNTKTTINLSISDLSDVEIFNLDNFKMEVIVRGTVAVLECVNKIKNSPTEITLYFKQNAEKKHLALCYFNIKINEISDKNWSSKNVPFSINIADSSSSSPLFPSSYTSFYGDLILNNPNDDAVTIIENSQQQVLPKFFKHLLVDSFTCEMVDLDNENYKYKINLMSETKGLEKIILPNISITQPIVGAKRTVWYYLNQYVNLYSTKIKMAYREGEWEYKNKYKIDCRKIGDYNPNEEYLKIPVHEIFDDTIFAPEMSLTAPTLREILSRLMIVKDCIPVVKNGVIYAMKISETHGKFITNNTNFSFISESLNSGNYSTAFRREYSGAISQKNSTHMVEFLGFRNKESALMTLDNMYLETRFPIYKITSLYMYYYKKIHINNTATNQEYDKLILVKQDISNLILQNAVRNALPADWTKLQKVDWKNITNDQMSKYRLLTLGYDIGSNKITGWGEKYSYIKDLFAWTKETYTYIETIINILDQNNPFGVGQKQFLSPGENVVPLGGVGWENCIVAPNTHITNITERLKSLFFKMDYIGMYSGAIVHSKENTEDDDIQTSDNCSAALSILEVDGLFEKEKANRLGNSEVSFVARFSSVEEMNKKYNDILGGKWEKDESVVVFHREYQIYDDCVLANFVATREYVMKNYFTTVFAKYRTYSYASYNETVNRTENDKYLLTISNDHCVFEKDNNNLLNIKSILSGFSESFVDNNLNIVFKEQINGGYFTFSDGKSYFSDVAQFVAGYSLCFNIKTFDSITNGNYISSLHCFDNGGHIPNGKNLYVGSSQEWYKMPIADNDGFLEGIGCYFGHFEDDDILENNVNNWNSSKTEELFNKIFQMPLKQRTPTFSFGKEYNICKDEKEIIDFTLQYEVVNQDDDILVSEWLLKLTDFNNYVKLSAPTDIINVDSINSLPVKIHFGSEFVNWNIGLFLGGWNAGVTNKRKILLSIPQENMSEVKNDATLINCYPQKPYYTTFVASNVWVNYNMYIYLTKIKQVIKNENNEIVQLQIEATYCSAKGMNNIVGITTLTFKSRKSEETGMFEFIYEGQEAPGFPEGAGLTFEHGSLSEAKPVIGGIVPAEFKTFKFPQTMFILKSTKKLEHSLVYAQYKKDSLPSFLSIVPISSPDALDGKTFKDIFSIIEDDNKRPFIQFKANSILGDDYESVQYWYYDEKGDGYFHFVFGINRTKEQGDEKAFISIVKNRNKKVYNNLHRVAGEVLDCALEENADKYGMQLYKKKGSQ